MSNPMTQPDPIDAERPPVRANEVIHNAIALFGSRCTDDAQQLWLAQARAALAATQPREPDGWSAPMVTPGDGITASEAHATWWNSLGDTKRGAILSGRLHPTREGFAGGWEAANARLTARAAPPTAPLDLAERCTRLIKLAEELADGEGDPATLIRQALAAMTGVAAGETDVLDARKVEPILERLRDFHRRHRGEYDEVCSIIDAIRALIPSDPAKGGE